MSLEGKIAIVIGAGIALDLAKQGAKVLPLVYYCNGPC
jgi:NAD(P)-dependent dehydrogenase (short-subunit alcohol dehydrogenase family)